MEVSKLSYEGDAINGTGGEDNKSVKQKMLEWLQANPDKCKRTNKKILSRQLADSLNGSESTFMCYLTNGLRDGIISRSGGKMRANFRINYFHPQIPQSLINSASDDDKKFIAEVHERAEETGGVVDNAGAIETPIEKPAPIEEPTIIERAVVTPAQAEEPVVEQTLPVEVKQTKQGTQITFTININL